jgi:RNA polymerase sigma factor (sigma-70 family)
MSNDQSVTDLVTRARNGDSTAWDALVERYAPLIWSICRRHRLADADARDVGQSVWLHLVSQLGSLRDPAALPGWLATTTRRECGRVLCAARGPLAAGYPLDAETVPDEQAATAEQVLLAAERHAALREALLDLPLDCQRLIALLIADPCHTPRSAPGWASRSVASGPPAADTWTSYASTRPSPRSSPPKPRRRDDIHGNALTR